MTRVISIAPRKRSDLLTIVSSNAAATVLRETPVALIICLYMPVESLLRVS